MNNMTEQLSLAASLKQIMYVSEISKKSASTDVVARRWAVFYTEAEKLLAYYEAMLAPKPSEENGSI